MTKKRTIATPKGGFTAEERAAMWPTSFALTALTPTAEARIAVLVRRAVV